MGPETIAFEEELQGALGAPHVVTVSSCTAAMSLCLRALGIGAGDEVICPSLTWCSTANAALYQGARPVFCEVDPASFSITPEAVAARLSTRTKAVMVVHFGGHAIDVRRLRSILPPHVAIVEDAAHALGATYADGRPVGSSGNPTCFSFYANKNVSTGEGGAVALFDGDVADHIRSLRQHALPIDAWKRFTHAQTVLLSQQLTELGFKANYTDLQAAMGRVQLRRQPQMANHRLHLAHRYLGHLQEIPALIVPQAGLGELAHARHLFPVRIKPSCRISRDHLLLELRKRNIGATVHYALLHRMPLYQSSKAPLPISEALGDEILTLPISASMNTDDVDYVCSHLFDLVR
jgi:dTDP-4-amino-4,6-dideoxygalactose transaminase